MLRTSVATFLLLSLVACGGGAARIADGKPVRFRGVEFDVPASWSVQSNDDGMRFQPEGANGNGVLEELYLLTGEPSLRTLDEQAVENALLQVVEQLQPGATKRSGPATRRFGDLDGRTWMWTGRSQFDKDVEIRAFAFLGDHACAVFAVGMPDALARRATDLDALLGSMRKPDAGASVATGAAGTADSGQELVGQWIWLSNFSATNGGGSQSNTWITLQADGRYQWHHDSVSTNPNGAAWGSQDESGAWAVGGATITFRPDGGAPYTQSLEKRNHPQNVRDPMIVLDGKAYVTASSRRPW